jgi:hypothetical protein
MTSYLTRGDPEPVDRVVTEHDMTPGNELRRAMSASLSAIRWQDRPADRGCGVADEEGDHVADCFRRDRVGHNLGRARGPRFAGVEQLRRDRVHNLVGDPVDEAFVAAGSMVSTRCCLSSKVLWLSAGPT